MENDMRSGQPTVRDEKSGPAKRAQGVKDKTSFTFQSVEEAGRYVNPVLMKVRDMVRSGHEETVPGWLNRLEQWLMRMERGNKYDARTPFFKRMNYGSIAKMVMGKVTNDAEAKAKMYQLVPYFYNTLVQVENHQADKIGPRGVFPPAHTWLDEKIQAIWSDKPPRKDLNRSALAQALKWLSGLVKPGSIDVNISSINEGFTNAGTSDADSKSLNVTTNSCYPTYIKGWYHKVWDKAVSMNQRMVQKLLVSRSRLIWQRCLEAKSYKDNLKYFHFVCTASQRTNVSNGYVRDKDNTYKGVLISKLRAVCAMPKLDTIIGKVFLNRLISVCKEIRNPDGTRMFVALTTPEVIDKTMQVILETAEVNHLTVLSTDFSGYDTTVPPWLAWEVAKAVSTWMTDRAANIFLALVYGAFYQTKCITTDKVFDEQPSSMKSGSWLTNIMDSLINLVAQRYGYEAGYYGLPFNQIVQGDDALITADGATPDSFEKAMDTLGFVANKDKQYFEPKSLSFCQKIHVLGYPGGIYPIARATAACVSLEDDVSIETDEAGQFPYVLAYRTICRLQTACFNPNFVSLVKLFQEEDKIHLGASMPAAKLAKLAGSYATKMSTEALEKPWKSLGASNSGFSTIAVNRVIRGELPPPPGESLFQWIYGVSYRDVAI